MPSDNTDYTKYAAIGVSILALGYTVWKDRAMNKRVKKVEQEQQREKQEAAIRRSKASAPYFSPSKKMIAQVYETGNDGGVTAWHGMRHGNVLSNQRREIVKDAPEKTPVIVVLDNDGKSARQITISGDIPGLEIREEPKINAASGLVYLRYPYSPTQHGKTQRVIFSFETEDGLDLMHVYETRHGFFEFHRIDPK